MYLPSDPLPVRKGKVLYHVFAEDAIERFVWEREWPTEVDKIVYVLITKPVDIHPVMIVNAPWTGTEVQE